MDKAPGRGRILPRYGISKEVDQEIQAHLDQRTEEFVAQGWQPDEARREALRVFGDRESVARTCRTITKRHQRAVRRGDMVDAVIQDLRYGWRTLVGSRAFTLVAVVTLALGVGANTAIFSVVHSVLLRPLPYERADELAWIRETGPNGGAWAVTWPNFWDWREESSSFAGIAAFGSMSTTVLGGEGPERVEVATISEDFWKVFPTRPLQGRLTIPEDFLEGAAGVTVVSRSLWQNELGGKELDRLVLEVGGEQVQVVGVISDDFDFPTGSRMWTASSFLGQWGSSRTAHNWDVVGRLAPGVSLDRAREELDALTRRIVLREPDADPEYLAVGATVVSLHDSVVGDSRRPLILLLGAAGLVLLVACTNLASTLLARGTSRERELAVRASLGAGRSRILRQLLTESLMLAGFGGLAGLGVAMAVIRGLQALGPSSLPRLDEIAMGQWAILFTAAVTAATVVLFGLLPAVRLARGDTAPALRAGSRGNALSGRAMIWKLLVGTEVALAMVLLVGSGLLVRSFQALISEDLGFDSDGVAALSVSLSQAKYPTKDDQARWYAELIRELEAQSDVAAAGVLSSLPMHRFLPNGRLQLDGDMSKQAEGAYVLAGGGAFQALNIPLLQGRLFEPADGPDRRHVAIVSRSFADRYWPGENPIGKQVTGGGMDDLYAEQTFSEVVGVVGEVRFRQVERAATPTVYFPYQQRPYRLQWGTGVVIKSATGDPALLTPSVRAVLGRLDSDVPLRIQSMPDVVSTSLADRRFVLLLLGGFSMVAFLLAGVGIYGVVSYSVARRRREVGIRLALGAQPDAVRQMVVSGAMRMVVTGLVAGTVGALTLPRLMASLLYDVSPSDPVTVAVVALVLAGAAFAASWLPARSGTRVDPMITMRTE